MDKFDRIFTLHQYLRSRRTPASLEEIRHHLECSPATAKRTISALRDYLGAPLVYDRERHGYCY
ncbi:MAG: HTH domain-containing protein, partial [Gammaproteobacteria bacterium]